MSTKMSERERIQAEKRLRGHQSAMYKVGDMVCFRPNLQSKRHKYGVIIEKHAPHFKIEHPSGEIHEIWVEQISHKATHIKFPGLCDNLVKNGVHPSRIDSWIKLLESLRKISKLDQQEAIDTLLRALKWAMPQCEQAQEEPVETVWQILLDSIPVVEVDSDESVEQVLRAEASRQRGYFDYQYECPDCEASFCVQTPLDSPIKCFACGNEVTCRLVDRVATK